MFKKTSIFVGSMLLVPVIASAQALDGVNNIASGIGEVVSTALPIAFALILIAFFWGLAKYVLAAGSEEKKAEGRNLMVGGVIALFVAASIWGIIYFIGDQLGVNTDDSIGDVGDPTTGILNN